jgi:pimeloyl-ACP methyl ester carboxylesterase
LQKESSTIITATGATLFFRDWGSGKPIVFVAGWALPSDMWSYQMVPLSAQGLRCIAYDRRGHGRSSDPGRGYDYDTLADDLASVIESLDLQAVTLVGYSIGSGEVVRYLTRYGSSRVARILLLAPTATPCPQKSPDNPNGLDPALFDDFRRNCLLRDFPKWMADNAGPFVVKETSPHMVDWVMGMMERCSLQALFECSVASSSADFRSELTKIALPTLVIQGDKDVNGIDRTGRKTAEMIPGARFEVYEGAPHGLFITHMDRLNQDLLKFARA